MTIRCADGTRRIIPVDNEGFLLINWPRCGADARTRHISAATVGAIYRQRKRLEKNRNLARLLYLDLAGKLGQAEMLQLYGELDKLYKKRIAAELAWYRASLWDPLRAVPLPTELETEEARIEAEIDKLGAALVGELDFYLQGAAEDERGKILHTRDMLGRLAAGNEQIKADVAERLQRLKPLVAGKLCMVGSTATGVADFVVTPVGQQTPGVMVHSNILNTIVSGAFVRQSGLAVNLLAIFAVGAVVSLLAATRPVLQAGPLTCLIAAAYAAFNAFVAFALLDAWLVLAAPLGAIVFSFLVVTAYRQLTEERAKKQI
ncbi:MAG: CHASE2 domain-containing protein, partial [Phycisphaerae bacterium]|nr:CHASE2 domain-containing protein [Phycisphaerae bacterium]